MRGVLFLLVAALSLALPLSAGSLAIDFTSQPAFGSNNFGSSIVLGWQFAVTEEIKVLGLTYYNNKTDLTGLQEAHDVGLYNLVGTLLLWSTVPAGGNDSTWWIWGSPMRESCVENPTEGCVVTSYTLSAGSYRVAGVSGSQDYYTYAVGAGQMIVDSRIQLEGAVQSAGNSAVLTYPTQLSSSDTGSYFGPNVMFSDVPEPSSWMLLAGSLVLGVLRRRR